STRGHLPPVAGRVRPQPSRRSRIPPTLPDVQPHPLGLLAPAFPHPVLRRTRGLVRRLVPGDIDGDNQREVLDVSLRRAAEPTPFMVAACVSWFAVTLFIFMVVFLTEIGATGVLGQERRWAVAGIASAR